MGFLKKILGFRVAYYLLLTTYYFNSPCFAVSWQEKKGDHFIIYYTTREDFARAAAYKAEGYYKTIAEDLGYPRYSNFWQWENRVKIYIHANETDFRNTTGEPGWSEGQANYSKKEIHTYAGVAEFLDGILPHEIAHLIFRDFVGMEGQIPVWMDEGVAQWAEPAKRELAKKVSRYLIETRKDYHIQDLMAMDVRVIADAEKVQNFYMQSVSLVDFLIKTYGPQSFTLFCRQLRDGKKFEEALRSVFPGSIETLYELDLKWRNYASEEPVNVTAVYS